MCHRPRGQDTNNDIHDAQWVSNLATSMTLLSTWTLGTLKPFTTTVVVAIVVALCEPGIKAKSTLLVATFGIQTSTLHSRLSLTLPPLLKVSNSEMAKRIRRERKAKSSFASIVANLEDWLTFLTGCFWRQIKGIFWERWIFLKGETLTVMMTPCPVGASNHALNS